MGNCIKEILLKKLKEVNSFWSYEEVQEIEDDNLIENVLLRLDFFYINLLFEVYTKNHIRRVWRERIVRQEPYYHNLNILIAYLYFDIKDPEKYIKREAPKLWRS